MNSPNYREGRSRVTEDIRREVSRLVGQEKDWESKKKHPSRWYQSEAAQILKLAKSDNPSLRSYEELLREVRKTSRAESGFDEPWNTANLEREPLSPELIPWIIGTQYNRKKYLSKPLTIREVKWFNRLMGFRNSLKPFSEIENNPDQKLLFITNVLATWSQIYAEREKIDFIAGIKVPDYSDLDLALASQDYKSILDCSDQKLIDRLQKLVATQASISQNQWTKLYAEWLQPALMKHIFYSESLYLHHSLGEPDMPYESLKAYSILLSLNDINFGKELRKDPYSQRIDFFIKIRQYCKDENISQTINSTMSDFNQWWLDMHKESLSQG